MSDEMRFGEAEGPGADDVWADLVARLEAVDSSSVPDPDESTAENPLSDEPGPGPALGFPSLAQDPVGPLAPRGPRDWDEPDPEELAEADGTDFVPEEPGPVLAGRPGVVIAAMAAIGIPILMVVLLIVIPAEVSSLGWTCMGLATVVALLYLGWSLPQHRKDDGDDGARV